jgi:DNA excision repair protein ERCC-5
MGVKSLWQLLSPSGRLVKIENLRGMRLAIDVSIWVIQYWSIGIKMGQENYQNLHLKGIMRRIVKMLLLG